MANCRYEFVGVSLYAFSHMIICIWFYSIVLSVRHSLNKMEVYVRECVYYMDLLLAVHCSLAAETKASDSRRCHDSPQHNVHNW